MLIKTPRCMTIHKQCRPENISHIVTILYYLKSKHFQRRKCDLKWSKFSNCEWIIKSKITFCLVLWKDDRALKDKKDYNCCSYSMISQLRAICSLIGQLRLLCSLIGQLPGEAGDVEITGVKTHVPGRESHQQLVRIWSAESVTHVSGHCPQETPLVLRWVNHLKHW